MPAFNKPADRAAVTTTGQANRAHRLRVAACTFLMRRDRPLWRALMNTTTVQVAAPMLAPSSRGTA